jgi:SAM-dependent methyltransferase
MICVVCKAPMEPDAIPDTYRCLACGFYASTLSVKINEINRLDEISREMALKPLRSKTFSKILEASTDLFPANASVLDVGCAHGWFMDAVKSAGYRCTGIEPDHEMAARTRSAGHNVIEGFFPGALPPGERYDVISFHDTFEHLPEIDRIVGQLCSYLNEGGLTIVNLPVSDGLIFRMTRVLARSINITGPYKRMWQAGLPSPHLSYFSADTLQRLFANAGFSLVRSGRLEAMSTKGLYKRICFDRNVGVLNSIAIYLTARCIQVFANAFPSDAEYFVFRKGVTRNF